MGSIRSLWVRADVPADQLIFYPCLFLARAFFFGLDSIDPSAKLAKPLFEEAVKAAMRVGASRSTALVLVAEKMEKAIENANGQPLSPAQWREVGVVASVRPSAAVVLSSSVSVEVVVAVGAVGVAAAAAAAAAGVNAKEPDCHKNS